MQDAEVNSGDSLIDGTGHNRAIVLTLTVLVAAGVVQAQVGEPIVDGYADGDYGRVRFMVNGLDIQRSPLADPQSVGAPDPADRNTPVFPGDALLTATDQRAEVELASGALVRIDQDTEVVFLALPAPYAETRDNTVLQLAAGSIRVDTRRGEREEFRIDTLAAGIYLGDEADARVIVDRHGDTEIIVRRGVIEVITDQGSTAVRSGMRTTVRAGESPSAPTPFNTFTVDGFDRWVAQREATDRPAAAGEAYADLPDEVQPYHRELSVYGTWDYEDSIGVVWSPSSVGSDWQPYRDGYWHYGPSGYFWVASEPWGWAPYHYGRWVRVGGRWCWAPGRVFGGSWVAWSWGPSHVGWAALDYWNRPAWSGGPQVGLYDSRCWTFVNYTTLAVASAGRPGPYRNTFTAVELGPQLSQAVVVTRAPHVSPDALRTSPEARASAVRLATEDREFRIDVPGRDGTRTAFKQHDATVRHQLSRGGTRTTLTPLRETPTPIVPLPTSTRTGSWMPIPGETMRSRTTREWIHPGGSLAPTEAPIGTSERVPANDPRQLYRRMSEQPRTRTVPAPTPTPPSPGRERVQPPRTRTPPPPASRRPTTRTKPKPKPPPKQDTSRTDSDQRSLD